MPNNENILVSVVVPCRNEIRFIRDFLGSVVRQDVEGLNLEIMIADGMSDDGTCQILDQYARQFPGLRVIHNPGKTAATGLNAAIRESKGEIIIRMDAHSEYAHDYIRNCVQVLIESGADNVGGPALTRADGYMAHAIALAFHTAFAIGGARFHDVQYEGYVDTVPYGCWRKSIFDRIGLFDEHLDRNQDDELNFRIISAGGRIWQSPRIVSWYRSRASLCALFRQYFQYGFWKVAVIHKHHRPASWRHLVPGTSLAGGTALMAGFIGARFAGASGLNHALLFIIASLAGLYCAASIGAALATAARNDWRYLPILPAVFATYHVSYGLGFLWGLLQSPANPAISVRATCVR